ncbi:MAG: hypothetical protein F4Y95_07840, partial [Chloroflexi bacterium]|nr:hypothetical protein [Chloroflexota bacterium]
MSNHDLLPPDQRLDIDLVRSLLTTQEFGQELHYLVQTSSTMDDARRLAEAGAPAVGVLDQALVLKDLQVAQT